MLRFADLQKEDEGVMTVKFKDPVAAQACVAKMDGRYFGGQRVRQSAQPHDLNPLLTLGIGCHLLWKRALSQVGRAVI